jgi:hypothetical protein
MSVKADQLEAAAAAKAAPSEPPLPVRAIDKYRVLDLAQTTGEPRQVVLENHLDPIEVINNVDYWRALPANMFPAGARLELTNDAGSYLFELWIRKVFGTAMTGIRGIQFHHRVVWDERDKALPLEEFVATGQWEARFEGNYLGWRVYRPNGIAVPSRFADETAARLHVREQRAIHRT